jgi:predicted permease
MNVPKLARRISYLFQRGRLNRELAEEMEAHREMMPPDYRNGFGNSTSLREESREAWSWMWLEQLLQDLSYGARVLWRSPGFTLGAVAILAIGIGVNLAEFQVFDALLFHRVNIRDASMFLQFTRESKQGSRGGFSSATTEFFRAHNNIFAWIVSEDTNLQVTVESDTGLRSNLVSANYFSSLGVLPSWGRLLDERDSEPGAPPVAALGYDYWQNHWASDPHVVGREVRINNIKVQIVGVLPYSFDGLLPRRTDVWLPLAIRPKLTGGGLPIQQDFSQAAESLFGVLKPGVSQAAGETELTSLIHELIRQQPRYFREDEHMLGRPVQQSIVKSVEHSPPMAVFLTMVLMVLLSACANLGNMVLARGLSRQRELHIRMSIGASRWRIVRQLMTENFILAILGTCAGIGLGAIVARVLLNSLNAPSNVRLQMSWPLLITGFTLTLISVVAFGLPSALRTVKPKGGRVHLRRGLVGVQVAVSCFLLIASAVLAHAGIANASVDLAFDYANMVAVDPSLYLRNPPPAVALQRLDTLSSSLAALPGVTGVTAVVNPPIGGRILLESVPGLPHVYLNYVAPAYFNVMNLPILRGRVFTAADDNALIVSESAARAAWPNQDPLGKTLRIANADRTVAGIVKDSGTNLIVDNESIEAYLPIHGATVDRSQLLLHVRGDPAPLARLIPSAAATVNETVAVTMLRDSHERFLDAQAKVITLIGSIGVVATALAAAGMFALVAFAVAQRKRELGIRIAIGAKSRHILSVLLSQNVVPTACGIVAGSILAAVVFRVVRSIVNLQHQETVDVIGFLAGIAFFVLIAALASLSPATRALRIDPAATLREE